MRSSTRVCSWTNSFSFVYGGLNTTDREHDLHPHGYTPTIHGFTAPVLNQASSSCRSACLFVSTMLHCGCGVTDSSSTQPRPRSSGRRQHEISQIPVRVGDDFVSPSTTVRDLGIYLDYDAAMKSDVSKTVANCFAALRQIHSVRRSVTRPVLLWLAGFSTDPVATGLR